MKWFIIGVTGVSGAGKTTVARFTGMKIIDADKIAGSMLKNPAIKRKLKHVFGPDIVKNGKIDRKRLAAKAFSSRANAEKLNFITHPLILNKIKKSIHGKGRLTTRGRRFAAVIDAPLLIESELHKKCNYVVAVKCSKRNTIKRNRKRHYDVRERTKHQFSEKQKIKHADFVVDNNGSRKETRRQVKEILKHLGLP